MDVFEREYFDEMKEDIEEIKELQFRIAEKLEVNLNNEEDIEEDTAEDIVDEDE